MIGASQSSSSAHPAPATRRGSSSAPSLGSAEADGASPATTQVKRKLTLMDLPEEVKKDIFAQCSQGDWICLSLVSKHFRDLAAAQLYRNFHIVFPDEDDPAYDSPIDGLAGGLDTFVTSSYDYAKHLRDLSLDTLSAGTKAEEAYKHYLYNTSCGKFMNTLLYLTLQKAKSLETFRWNIRVELSRPVFKALHSIETLKNVHIRLQKGPSLYETPPPLPYPISPPSTSPSASQLHLPETVPPPPPPPPPVSLFAMPAPTSLFGNSASNGPPPITHKPSRAKTKRSTTANEPPTLSGFKKLRSLAVLDMDDLDAVTEIKACVRNSTSTLTDLKLSFSDQLALQARKPQPDADMDDSDQDDEFQVVTGPHPSAPYSENSLSLPAKMHRAAEERKGQEAVLGRIFDVEPYVVKKSSKRIMPQKDKDTEEGTPAKKFINAIKLVSTKLMLDLNRSKGSGPTDLSASQQEILATIESAARKYVASDEAKSRFSKADSDPTNSASDASASTSAGAGAEVSSSSSTPDAASGEEEPAPLVASSGASASGVASSRSPPSSSAVAAASGGGGIPTGSKEVAPEDINIEEPEEQLSLDGHDTPGLAASTEESESTASKSGTPTPTATPKLGGGNSSGTSSRSTDSPGLGKAMANLAAQKVNFETLSAKLESHEEQADILSKKIQALVDEDRLAEAGRQVQNLDSNILAIQQEMRVVEAEMADAEKQTQQVMLDNLRESSGGGGGGGDQTANADVQGRRVSEYIRATRGLQLESLSLYLVPVKASVLSRAIDLRVLTRITLLNVGTQGPIWALFAKENKQSPLPLRNIFTDNVTPGFLSFVHQLEELHEFLIMEREHKYKPESFAAKTSTTTELIRQTVLKKHLPTLRKLMIKNMESLDWDIDEKTTRLICRKGKVLEELAVSMNIRAVHTLMQNIAGLSQLHALLIIQLRNDDTCVWVMRETKKFLIDNLSHHPEMKLEWISIDDGDRLEKIVKVAAEPKKKKSKKSKGKEKAPLHSGINGIGAHATPAASVWAPPQSFGMLGSVAADNDVFPILPSLDSWDAGVCGSDNESDSDGSDDEGQHLKLATLNGVNFSDVWGVTIFKKEVVSGRL